MWNRQDSLKKQILKYLTLICLAASISGCHLTTENTDFLDDFIPVVIPAERVKNYERDLVYASPDGHDLTLDVSWPEGDGPFPMLVWVHGGNYNHFSKESGEALARYVTNRGYVVVNVNYRKVPAAHLKEITEDVMGAVIWAKDHAADYHGDPKRLAVSGHSAGAQMVAVVALACGDDYFTPTYQGEQGSDACPAAVITVGGYFEFEEEWANWNPWLLGVERAEDEELYEKCEPASYDLAGLPPHLIVFGEEDMHRQRGEAYALRLTEAGVDAETHMVPGADHHFVMWHWRQTTKQGYDKMVEFLDERM